MKPSIPKGTRDFTPEEMAKRTYIFDTLKKVFRTYGFQQIETPAMENLSTLMGKYGEEGDKLLFKILNSGDWLSALTSNSASDLTSNSANKLVSEKGLRYDLTVPFARFVVQNREKIVFPFRRYQIQPVWRADRPQKGRYREFYQCDVDVVGTDSLLCEAELISIVKQVYKSLGIRVCLKLNNRKILAGIAELIGMPDKLTDITVAIDKLDKMGLEKVNEELLDKGLTTEAVDKLQPIFNMEGSNEKKLQTLKEVLKDSLVGLKGIEELEQILALTAEACQAEQDDGGFSIEIDLTLARGLNYYTGAIFEVKALDVEIGSITGGGRYDNLTGIFGMPGVSGVGISFGADRIYDVLNQLNLYPETSVEKTCIMFAHFGEKERKYAFRWAEELRSRGVNAEVYPDVCKIKKQMDYANRQQIQFVAVVGETEMQNNTVNLKNMQSGEQMQVNMQQLVEKI
ncbi:MAG: histidine--tRNA ligase [Paludibacteraceae bacterium]|nr:histidine--tRNA ligase [Paludibacteraceae bacterium]